MKRVPGTGVIGEHALREAAASEFGQVVGLVRSAVRKADPNVYDMSAIYPDRVVFGKGDGRQYAYPYTVGDDNTVTLGQPFEVVAQHVPAVDPAPAPVIEAAPVAINGEVFIEAIAAKAGDKPSRYLVRVIRAGTSLNHVTYPAAVLREAAPLFNGVRVFVKSDDEHLKGGGKDFRQLVGRLTEAKFVAGGKDGGEIQAVLDVLESTPVAATLREAVARGMTDLFGLSIDAAGSSKQSGKFREATKLTKVASVDLIIEPGAGGQFIRFAEAKPQPREEDTMLRSQMIAFIEARDAKRAEGLAEASDDEVLTAYREAVKAEADAATAAAKPAPAGVTPEQVAEQIRMVEARANARVTIAEAKLPAAVKERLAARFAEAATFKTEDVDAAIKGEREFLAKLTDGAKVTGLGEFVEAGEDRADKVGKMLDEFFDPTKRARSFRECYIDITGDRNVTGLMQNVDVSRLREAMGGDFREAISASTFSSILGDSITRAMIAQYGSLPYYQDWQWLTDIVPVNDFRTQQRVRMGGYGNLPAVNEAAAYAPLTSPGDEKATYAISKRGGLETISLETIANDDVGVIRRIPTALATAASRTLYEFVYSFLTGNGAIYDTKALFIAAHNNLGTAALDATSYAAARLAMAKQTELSSSKRLGLVARHVAVPPELEETAYNLFVRSTNLDKTFVQSLSPTVHVISHATDANDWFVAADKSQCPLIELGFYGGNENPELFVQDLPTQGSLFSNDQVTYKIRHIYGGAVVDYRGLYGATVA